MAKKQEEEKYVITPKGIAVLAMMQSGLIVHSDDPRFEGFWRMFEEDMKRLGYIVEDEKE